MQLRVFRSKVLAPDEAHDGSHFAWRNFLEVWVEQLPRSTRQFAVARTTEIEHHLQKLLIEQVPATTNGARCDGKDHKSNPAVCCANRMSRPLGFVTRNSIRVDEHSNCLFQFRSRTLPGLLPSGMHERLNNFSSCAADSPCFEYVFRISDHRYVPNIGSGLN